MSVTASPELMALCQSQFLQLRRMFGMISAAVYLTDSSSPSGQPTFVPVISYPEKMGNWPVQWQVNEAITSLPSATDVSSGTTAENITESLSSINLPRYEETIEQPSTVEQVTEEYAQVSLKSTSTDLELESHQQVVLPLVYADVVVGLLVLMRPDRNWREEEHRHLQGIANGIAAGCVLDRRNQWLQQRLRTKRTLQGRQSEVFHNLMHQFRNPLTALSTFGKLLLRRLKPDDPNYAIADNILRESGRLQALITDFDETVEWGDIDLQTDLELPDGTTLDHPPPAALAAAEPSIVAETDATIETTAEPASTEASAVPQQIPAKGLGRSLDLKPEWISPLVRPLWDVTEIIAADRQLKTWSQLSASATAVLVDRAALQEVLANLLDNAVKYSPGGAWVWLLAGARRVQDGQSYQGIVIGDTGPSIPPSDQTQLFQRYYRGVQAKGNITGTGLGLAIAADLVHQMQGQIDVISPVRDTDWLPDEVHQQLTSADGPGTAFIVWLPEID